MNCSQQQLHNWNPAWDSQIRNLNGSNMSLNLPPHGHGYYPQQVGWTPNMYPYPIGMIPVINQGSYAILTLYGKICSKFHFDLGMPNQNRSRAPSRNQSRAASPALSIRSKKSVMSGRHMNRNFMEHELTDDEDSGSDGYVDDFRSLRGRRESSARSTASRRSRQNSTHSSIDLEEDSETFSRGNPKSSSRSNRELRRSNSLARSVQSNWTTKQNGRNRDAAADFTERNVLTENRTTYDSPLTPDSESESGTKALVQAKIREKLAQQSSMDESSSDFWKPKATSNIRSDNTNNVQAPKPKSKVRPDNTNNAQASESNDIQTTMPPVTVEVNPELVPDTATFGPPPRVPEYQWQCEFCTFVNEPQTTICIICCKTPTNEAIKVVQPDEQTTNLNKSPPPLPKKSPPKEDARVTPPENEAKSSAAKPPSTTTLPTKSKTTSSSEENSSNSKLKGRTRKISFWPGTKSK